MRTNLPAGFDDIWRSGVYLGDQKSFARATIQLPKLYTASAPHNQRYASWIFPQLSRPKELPNIQSVVWDRDPQNGTGSCTLRLYNTKAMPVGSLPSVTGRLDAPGYYTYNRGHSPYADRWNQHENEWQGYLVYDRIVRTYEGYGVDPDVPPELDPNLVKTGTWTIHYVDYDTDPGMIIVTMRDGAGGLVDDIAFPPVVPLKKYPLAFTKYVSVPGPDHISIADSGWHSPKYRNDSGYAGGYVGRDASIYGHKPSHAFDGSPNATYWLSIGNDRPSADYSYEYVEGTISGTITGVRVHAWGGPYRVYVGVYAGGKWQGRLTVPYNPHDIISAPNGSNVRYVKAVTIGENDTLDIVLPKPIPGASRLRITLTHLTDSGKGPFPYRGGLRDVKYTGQTITRTPTTKVTGNYGDYTDIIKLLLAYGGFWWPRDHSKDVITRTDGTQESYPCPYDDPYLGLGRIWGDLQNTGTAGIVPLTLDIFDKKPLMDCINYIKEIIGFIFMVDEDGAAIWRSPNVWHIGNYVGDLAVDAGRLDGEANVITIDERNTLIALQAKVTGENVREHIVVANTTGRIGAVAKGHNPYPTGKRRTAGWTDQNFATTAECQIMADLIGLRQFMTMRQDTVTIPGNPAIQCDDQVRIIEEVTGEGYLHYVNAIHSDNNLESGAWTYQLTTNWLGDSPDTLWLWDSSFFSDATRQYLQALGQLPS